MATAEMTLHGLSLDLSGWFQVGWSNELEPSDVLPKHYFGRDLVVFLDSPALATSEGRGFRAMRRWTMQFYPGDSEFTAGRQSLDEGDTP
jgi:hypothetical protein